MLLLPDGRQIANPFGSLPPHTFLFFAPPDGDDDANREHHSLRLRTSHSGLHGELHVAERKTQSTRRLLRREPNFHLLLFTTNQSPKSPACGFSSLNSLVYICKQRQILHDEAEAMQLNLALLIYQTTTSGIITPQSEVNLGVDLRSK